MTAVLTPNVDRYLAHVRAALRGVPTAEADDILRELHSHIDDLTRDGTDARAALNSLGDPVDLAKTYTAAHQLVRAECSASPLVILQGLRHASRSRWGRLAVTALYLFGYMSVLTLWSAVIDKLFTPSSTGLWYMPGNPWSLTLVSRGSPPAGGRELLGWWFVPIGAGAGWVLRAVIDWLAQAWIRRYRRVAEPQDS